MRTSKYLYIYINIYLMQNQKREESNISNKWQHLTCIEVSFSNENLQNDIVTPRL